MMTAIEAVSSPAGLSGRPVYELIEVSKTYDKREVHALDNINLSLTEGSFSAIIGPSGCGKSTLLKIMTGLLSPSEGSVVLSGKPVTGPRRDIGMMFQEATLFPWRTTIENVVLPIEIREGKQAALPSTTPPRPCSNWSACKISRRFFPANCREGWPSARLSAGC